MKFLNKAKLKFEDTINGVKWYSLKEPLQFDTGKEIYIVPAYLFFTDLATIPKGLQWLYKPNGKYTDSAVLHDYLYSDSKISRSYADYILREAMKSQGVSLVTCWTFWGAVRLFGGSHQG